MWRKLLPDASKAHLVAIWLLASRYNNEVPADAEWIARKINATTTVDLTLLEKAEFIKFNQLCSEPLAHCKQVARPERETETQVETEKEGEKDTCAEPLSRSTPEAEPDTPVFLLRPFIALPTNKAGEEFSVMPPQVDEFHELYPAVDVRQALRSMRGWLLSNPKERKTLKGMARFINGWLEREQNKGSRGRNNGRSEQPTAHENLQAGTLIALKRLGAA
jgi:hypothetical protein